MCSGVRIGAHFTFSGSEAVVKAAEPDKVFLKKFAFLFRWPRFLCDAESEFDNGSYRPVPKFIQ